MTTNLHYITLGPLWLGYNAISFYFASKHINPILQPNTCEAVYETIDLDYYHYISVI